MTAPTTSELTDLMSRADAIIKELAKLIPMRDALREWRHDDLKMLSDCVEQGYESGSPQYDTCLHESEMDLRDIVGGLRVK